MLCGHVLAMAKHYLGCSLHVQHLGSQQGRVHHGGHVLALGGEG